MKRFSGAHPRSHPGVQGNWPEGAGTSTRIKEHLEIAECRMPIWACPKGSPNDMLNPTVKRSLLIQRLLGLRQAHLAQGPLVAWALILVALVACHSTRALGASTSVTVHSATQQYCVSCHDADSHKGGLNLANLLDQDLSQHTQDWEKVVRKLRTRQMPPIGKDRPSDREYERLISEVSESLDSIAVRHPRPGRTETFRRLNRTEYQNAIRDLLALNIDASTLLPNEDPSHGFDKRSRARLQPS